MYKINSSHINIINYCFFFKYLILNYPKIDILKRK